jgi:OmpA-OmpF porin, OOP family
MRQRMKVTLISLACVVGLGLPLAAQEDAKGCQDHPLFTRMPDYVIRNCTVEPFASHQFAAGGGTTATIEGRLVTIVYDIRKGATAAASLQINRNYAAAARAVGGTVMVEREDKATVKVVREGKEVWAQTSPFSGGIGYKLIIVEREAMQQDVVANADKWLSDINATGHASVYGIYFDTDKAVIKPESEPVLAEIAKLLANIPALNLHVVGHTDSTGAFDHNMTLSKARADAVMNALVSAHGVAASRLQASGVGPLAPVASNDTEDGRAKNRRVELVKR